MQGRKGCESAYFELEQPAQHAHSVAPMQFFMHALDYGVLA